LNLRIVGYTDPLCVAPGQRLHVMVSTREPRFAASVKRLAGGGGPTTVESEIEGIYEGCEQEVKLGSYVVMDEAPPVEPGAGFAVEAWIYPTAPRIGRPQAIAGRYDGVRGYALGIDEAGRAALWLDGHVVAAPMPLMRREWYHVRGLYDERNGRARVVVRPRVEWPGAAEPQEGEGTVGGWSVADAPFCLAAWCDPAGAHYNGKIEAPRVLDRAGALVAGWDLGGDFASELVVDVSGGRRHGRCVNLPMRAVTGYSWRGACTDPTLSREEYAAIWFHDDDLEDAGWTPAFELRVPVSWATGVYAVRIEAGDEADEIPFFVRPRRGRAEARIAVLMPTFSYLAYGNEHSSWAHPIPATPRLEQILASVGERDRYAFERRLKSLYEMHTDGSGVAYCSRLRPIVNMRADYKMPLLVGGPHQFSADMQLLRWLDRLGTCYDVITDEDLHYEGEGLLSDYRVLVTGSHPEYWSAAMLDGLEAWLDDGGRLMYLGGNGFYWVTSVFPDRPHVIEVRRGHAGTGVWRSEPGEVHHASTGEQGGLWRFRGRAPQRIAGVGMTAQGFDQSMPYRIASRARSERAAWIFEGVGGEEIGAHGAVLGGAAGFEIDRADSDLGTPPNALTVATARGFSDAYQATSEDILTSDSRQGGTVSPLVRADMVFFERARGGAVFSTGSIAWCGALLDNDCQNDISKITENVLRRFARDGPVV